MGELRLRPPTLADEDAVRTIQAEMDDEQFPFALFLDEEPDFAHWLDRLDRYTRGEVDDPRHVRSRYLLAEVDGELVGRVSIRLELNDWLREWGGHIGYGVRRACRRRGHATEILRQALAIVAAEGIDPALVTCDDDNVASAAVIERLGGVLQDRIPLDRPETGRILLRRYHVPTGA